MQRIGTRIGRRRLQAACARSQPERHAGHNDTQPPEEAWASQVPELGMPNASEGHGNTSCPPIHNADSSECLAAKSS